MKHREVGGAPNQFTPVVTDSLNLAGVTLIVAASNRVARPPWQ